MNAFTAIKQVMNPYGIPCKPYTIRTKPLPIRYMEYNYVDDYGADFGDDEPGCNVTPIQLHYYCPVDEDFLSIKNEIREKLFAAGFTYPQITVLENEGPFQVYDGSKERTLEAMRHLVFECEYEEDR